jgi:hypothetical protein
LDSGDILITLTQGLPDIDGIIEDLTYLVNFSLDGGVHKGWICFLDEQSNANTSPDKKLHI